jgi:hypothetical protein
VLTTYQDYKRERLVVASPVMATACSERHVRRKGAAPISGAEEQTASAINAYAQGACLLSLQMGSLN